MLQIATILTRLPLDDILDRDVGSVVDPDQEDKIKNDPQK
jgi:hypothetical protein